MININLNSTAILSMSKLADIVLSRITESILGNVLPSGDNSSYTRKYALRKARGAAARGQVSTHTSNVNMLLTGGMLRSLKKDKIMETKAVLKYAESYNEAIDDNENRGRSVRKLSAENIQLVEEEFAKDVEIKIAKEFEQNNNVTIGG